MRLAERLNALRHRQFVGRSDELTRFESILESQELPYHIIHVYGPGGIGKTSLLKKFSTICTQHNAIAIYLDARNIEPVPGGFLEALRAELRLAADADITDELAGREERHVILIDTYETLAPLDDWLREEFLPRLSENVLLITAGRNVPSAAWNIDPGWRALVRVVPLRNLSTSEARELLVARNIPDEQHHQLLEFTHGHPLALSLIADVVSQRPSIHFEPDVVPDVIRTLLGQFVEKVPGPAHRAALESCALVRVMTEGLLAEMLAREDVHELFEWLRGLSFIESGSDGLFPHDLAREALLADVRWRNPDWYVELHKRARNYYALRIRTSGSQDQQRILYDYVFLHRDNSIMRAIFQWQGGTSLLAEPGTSEDIPHLIEMVRRHEGEQSADYAAYWFTRQPEGILVIRSSQGTPVGLLMMLRLQHLAPEERVYDPAVKAVWEYLIDEAPLRPGEGATFFRFWMADEGYQSVSPVQSIIFVNVGRHYLTEPGLAYTFFPCRDPEFWAPGFAYIDLHRHKRADVDIDGNHHGIYGHDWRVVPAWQWLSLLAEREVGAEPSAVPEKPVVEALVLSEEGFAEAVRSALRSFSDPTELQRNPLLRSRMVLNRLSGGNTVENRVDTLRALLRTTVNSLEDRAKGDKYFRALDRTYLHPVASQERAAELLSLPFSTYRRHLTSGIDRVVRYLWQLELGWNEHDEKQNEQEMSNE